jgi:hypothetical protein
MSVEKIDKLVLYICLYFQHLEITMEKDRIYRTSNHSGNIHTTSLVYRDQSTLT